MHKIDMNTWPRAELFRFFSGVIMQGVFLGNIKESDPHSAQGLSLIHILPHVMRGMASSLSKSRSLVQLVRSNHGVVEM